jgi:hypothetical protein
VGMIENIPSSRLDMLNSGVISFLPYFFNRCTLHLLSWGECFSRRCRCERPS